eukprot:4000924-Pleurochrysis_carterae.AAC.1
MITVLRPRRNAFSAGILSFSESVKANVSKQAWRCVRLRMSASLQKAREADKEAAKKLDAWYVEPVCEYEGASICAERSELVPPGTDVLRKSKAPLAPDRLGLKTEIKVLALLRRTTQQCAVFHQKRCGSSPSRSRSAEMRARFSAFQ